LTDFFSEKRILVTGGAGFIGSNLVRRLLSSGAEVHLLVRPSTDLWRLKGLSVAPVFHFVDLLDQKKLQEAFAQAAPGIVFHLAMPSGHPASTQARREMLRVSCEGTYHLLEATMNYGIQKFIHAGSSMEYGPRNEPLNETMIPRPKMFRGVAKAVAGMLCQHYAEAFHLPVCTLRFFYVYGPWEAPTRFIPTLLRCALTNESLMLTGQGIRHDFVFVEDVVDACYRAAEIETVPGDTLNIGSGLQWSNEDAADLVQEVTGRKLTIRVGEHPGQPPDTTYWVADIAKAERVLGWRPAHQFSQGLLKTFEWTRQHV